MAGTNIRIYPAQGKMQFHPITGSSNIDMYLTTGSTTGGTKAVLVFSGSTGDLFAILDSFDGSLMAVSGLDGIPILEVFDTDKIVMGEFGTNALVVDADKVGIGIETPQNIFEVGSAGVTGLTVSSSDIIFYDTGGTTPMINFNRATKGIIQAQNQDIYNIFGRGRIDSRNSDEIHFSHVDQTSTDQYAIKQLALGATWVNAQGIAVSNLYLAADNIKAAAINLTGTTFYEDDGTTKIAQFDRDSGNTVIFYDTGGTTSILTIERDSGNMGIPQLSRFYLDTDKDSYIYGAADDIVDIYAGGSQIVRFQQNRFGSGSSLGPAFFTSQAANPSGAQITWGNDTDTGIAGHGDANSDTFSLMTGGVNNVVFSTSATTFYDDTGTGATITVNRVSGQTLFADGSQTIPSISFISNPDTGIFLEGSANIRFTFDGDDTWYMNSTIFRSLLSSGPALMDSNASATVPNIITRVGDTTTGFGGATNQLSSIINSTEIVRVTESGMSINDTSQEMRFVKITLSTGDIDTLNGTSVIAISAPGSGKFIQYLGGTAKLNHVTTAFTGGSTLGLQYSGETNYIASTSTGFIDTGANRIEQLIKSQSTFLIVENTALELTCLSDASGGGTSTIDVWIQYMIIDTA